MPPWPSSRNQCLSAAVFLRCMPYFSKCTESFDGRTPVTFLLSQNLEIYFRWQILTRVVNFCPYQICSCPCDTKLKLIPQYSWVQAASRFYNHVPRTLLNRHYSPTFPRTTGRHFYIRCCFPKSSTKFSLQSLTPLAESTGPGESAGLYWVCAKASRASCAITELAVTPRQTLCTRSAYFQTKPTIHLFQLKFLEIEAIEINQLLVLNHTRLGLL